MKFSFRATWLINLLAQICDKRNWLTFKFLSCRSLIRMRVTKQRKDFAAEMGCLEKDPADNTYDLKPAQRTQAAPPKKRKVLSIGL